ncbi:MAG TPA: peptidylprolyl isomerase [Candidatus Angelobacter sp.]|nr:peptidylprolyl isomerase [Candidatus Angelobacter sp.]
MSQLLALLFAVAPMAAFSVTPDQPGKTNSVAAELSPDTVIAKGKGVEVKQADIDAALTRVKAMYAARGMPVPADLEEQALRQIVFQQLVLAQATDADRAKGKADFEDRVAKLKASAGLTDEEFNKRIAAQLQDGETRQEWDKKNIEGLTVPIVLERELGVNVTDADAKKFYDDPTNTPSFEQPEMVRASHILLMTEDPKTHEPLPPAEKEAKRKEMEGILKQARAGTNFAELAKKYSEDPGSKDNGGEYTFPRGQMVPEFEKAAFALQPGQISDIIETKYGFHIIKLSEKIPAKKVDFDKVKDRIKERLSAEEMQKQIPAYSEKLLKAANVQILDPKLKGVNLAITPAKD